MKNKRFLLKRTQIQPNSWVCTDIESGIVCVYEHQNFNDNHKFSILEDIKLPDTNKMANIVNDMTAWLRGNHYWTVLPCNWRYEIGNRIRRIRKQQGLTQEELAQKAGLMRENINTIEKGKYSTGIDILGKIADALKCDINFNE
ncbi:MAG: helix-turn-helix domain-containing protein [Prevotellaceae bacterium]|jgi:DNA-binding XRE family transcriptional regulator|nr:helix-turn-helix domain-containing protein [Prevotellaceae bacterium]